MDGSVISAMPVRGPDAINRMSLAIFARLTAMVFICPDASTHASFAPRLEVIIFVKPRDMCSPVNPMASCGNCAVDAGSTAVPPSELEPARRARDPRARPRSPPRS
jgi:hypothetical protein